ncbi:MAG: hypothetical protein HY907_02020 [Deltaproteobacteria bacterium]|nr:hypothetical protein [Deltaproteobacteria bacterium]
MRTSFPTQGDRIATSRPALAVALAAAASVAGCASDMAPQSLVERFRIIAVRADVPDGPAGTTVTLDALVADPQGEGRALSWLWVACLLGPSLDPEACADPERGGIVGIGMEPTFTFTTPPPAEDRTEAQVMVTLAVCAGGTFELPADGGAAGTPGCAGGDGAVAYKRVFSRETGAYNHNPGLAGLTLDGAAWGDETSERAACTGDSCEPLELIATLAEGAAETWTEIAFGSPRQRTEEVYVSWFATAGSFERIRSGGEEPTVEWTPPEGPAAVDFWIVVHDGRGGTDWATRRIELR